ncbi:MAG: hypothetical protein WBD95_14630 [Xanthobacteraceae bacterium]
MDQIALSSRADSAQSASDALCDGLPSKRRSRRTNNVLAGIDVNTAIGRRVADLVRGYLAALGNPQDVGRQAAVIAAAELLVLAEETRAAALRDPLAADLDNLVRVQSVADRALRRLGIKPGAPPKPPSLKEYIASLQAAPATTGRGG